MNLGVTSRIMGVSLKFEMIKGRVFVSYVIIEGDNQERERGWNNLKRVLDRVLNGYKLCVMGDLNRWVSYRVEKFINDAFEKEGEW